ncbi:MAG: hypothetical protein AAF226_04215 [Verrucomicrobiota bacterium]
MTVLFLLGMGCGVLLSVAVVKHKIKTATSRDTAEFTPIVLKFLDRRLDLSKDQENSVRQVLLKGEQEVLPLRKELRRNAYGIFLGYQPQIAEHLDEDQKAELNRIIEGLLQTWRLEKQVE